MKEIIESRGFQVVEGLCCCLEAAQDDFERVRSEDSDVLTSLTIKPPFREEYSSPSEVEI